jgi:hypothetical protein
MLNMLNFWIHAKGRAAIQKNVAQGMVVRHDCNAVRLNMQQVTNNRDV